MWTDFRKQVSNPHEESAMHCQHEDRRDHAAGERPRHVHSGYVDPGAEESLESRKLHGFCTAEKIFRVKTSQVHVRTLPCKQKAGRGCKEMRSCDERTLTQNVDGKALEEVVDCDIEDETNKMQK